MKPLVMFMLILLIPVFFVFSQINDDKKPFTLTGEIVGLNTGKVFLRYAVDYKVKIDTAVLNNGKFIFNGSLYEPKRVTLFTDNNVNKVEFYIEPGDMKVKLEVNNFDKFKITGSKTQEELNALNLRKGPLLEQRNLVRNRIHQLRDSLSKIVDEKGLDEKIENTREFQLFNQIGVQLKELDLNFVTSHPKSFVSVELLLTFDLNEIISLDSLKTIYDQLDPIVQNGTFGRKIKADIIKKENNVVGAFAPDFKAKDINNKVLTLSQFKGKNVVLLDFWASWCVPCRKYNPFYKELYKKYHSKGLEIIGISMDYKKEAWLTAIKKDSVDIWFHIPVAENLAGGLSQLTKDDVYSNYFVQSIPRVILIDRNGKIIDVWGGYSTETEEIIAKKVVECFENSK